MAAKNFGRVNVSITASTGGLTAGLSRASKQLGGFAGQAQGIGGRLTAMAAGFVGAGRAASLAAIGVKALSVAIKSLLGPLLIVTSLVSIFAAFGRSARELDEAGKTARRLGMSMTSFQNLGQVAEEAGVSMGQMGTLLTFMTRNLGNLANGSTSAQKAFGRLGLTMGDLASLSPERQFELISQRIMALPTAAERTAAAMSIFGRQGAMAMGLIADASTGAVSEVAKLREQLGLNLTDAQVKGIEMMNDAVGRLSLVFGGFINQFLAELAPAVTTVANLIVRFFAESTSGFSIATSLAQAFVGVIKGIAGAVTFLYGAFQVLSSFVGVFITGAIKAFEGVTYAIQQVIGTMAAAAEALPGFDVGLASGLRNAERTMAGLSNAASQEAELWGQAAADNLANGIRNMSHPFAAFDAEFASVQAQMQQAGAAGGTAAGEAAASAIAPAIAASTQALKAIVVGTGEGEAFRNSILRGADPRNEGDSAKETADNTAEMVDQLDELNGTLASSGGLGLADNRSVTMAITDVRILRSLKLSESKSDKQTIQMSASQELLFVADSRDPSFNEILQDDNIWPNLGNDRVPQLDDEVVVKGITLYVTNRELSYYKDNERAVVMTIRYDAKAPEDGESEQPQGTDAETWKKITVTSQQMTKPAVGWPSRGAMPAENGGDEGHGAQNSAGDPVDGLEEDCGMVKLTYTNTQVLNPVFSELQRYTNRCNDGAFLGGGDYTVRMVGWNAEYDQKNNVWSVSVEFLYNPDGWQIQYFDAGYNEIIGSDRRAILDKAGNPVSKPVPLNGSGQAQTINPSPSGDDKPTEPVTLELYPYKIADMSALFANCGI